MIAMLVQMLNGNSSGKPGLLGDNGGWLGTGFKGIIPMLFGKKDAPVVNDRPVLKESGMYNDLVGFFEGQMQYGIDPAALKYATEKNQSGLTASLNTVLQSGGNPNQVNDLYSKFTDSINNLSLADSDRRWQKVNAFSGASDKLFEAKREEFLYNQDAPYKDRAQALTAKANADFMQSMINSDNTTASLMKMLNSNYAAPGAPAAAGVTAGSGQETAIQQFMKMLQQSMSGTMTNADGDAPGGVQFLSFK